MAAEKVAGSKHHPEGGFPPECHEQLCFDQAEKTKPGFCQGKFAIINVQGHWDIIRPDLRFLHEPKYFCFPLFSLGNIKPVKTQGAQQHNSKGHRHPENPLQDDPWSPGHTIPGKHLA